MSERLTRDEILKNQKEFRRQEAELELKNASAEIGYFKDRMIVEHGIRLIDDHFRYVEPIGVVLVYPGIVDFLITERKDKEGLYDFAALAKKFQRTVAGKGVFRSERFYLLADNFFRRRHHSYSNFEPSFLFKFWNYANPDVRQFIALDENRVRIDTKAGDYMEFDQWYGPPFNNDIAHLPDDLVKLRPPGEITGTFELGFFGDAYAVDIKWYTTTYTDDKITPSQNTRVKAFQAEEFKQDYITLKYDGQIYHPVRYIHAEYDLDQGYFKHFDGALHLYTPEEYFARRDQDFHYNLKNPNQIKTRSEKLFKFDGKMPVKDWVEFCGLYFTQNPLMYEYFTGKLPEDILVYVKAFEEMRRNPD